MESGHSFFRQIYYHAARRMLARDTFEKEAAIAKLISSEAAMDIARDASLIHVGYAFMNETVVARHYRDSKIFEIGEGTSEVQLLLTTRELGL
jgi:short/branched chain acyl-CoA dehydrogenase